LAGEALGGVARELCSNGGGSRGIGEKSGLSPIREGEVEDKVEMVCSRLLRSLEWWRWRRRLTGRAYL
jgi:hypothetical protein